jgi:Putative auto-transporter adhesin, head GIN domain
MPSRDLLAAFSFAGIALAAPAWAQMLDISACMASIQVQAGGGDTPQWLEKPSASLNAKLTGGSGLWQLQCEPPKSSSTQTVIGSRIEINRAIGPGAVATQNIGGNTRVQKADEVQPIKLSVPGHWRLQAKRWSGELQASGSAWQLDMELGAASVKCTHVRDSRLVLEAASVEIGKANGSLNLQIKGAGSVEVAQMQQTALDIQMTGAGSIDLKGSAASAKIRASGAGSIDIEHVASEPLVQISGAVTIDIGR